MKIYYYPFWRKQYLFHQHGVKDTLLTSIYQPYSRLTSLLWFLWKSNSFVRKFFVADCKMLPIPLSELAGLIRNFKNCRWVFNLGSEHYGNRLSAIVRENGDGNRVLFVKIGISDQDRKMVQNEHYALQALAGNQMIPRLLSGGNLSNSYFIITEAFNAHKLSNTAVDEKIIATIVEISGFKEKLRDPETHGILAFAHGDFCPWNLMEIDGGLRVIDWEMASYYPLGYDLFTFIFQSSYLIRPKFHSRKILNENLTHIESFFARFGLVDWTLYLSEFADMKSRQYETDKKLGHRFRELVVLCKNL